MDWLELSGIVPPLVTPLRDRDTLDEEGMERLVERAIEGGVSGLFILGTTGEAVSLGYRLRRDVISRVCAQAGGRVPVLVGVTDTAFVESVALARVAAEAGAAAVVLTTPYYFPAGQRELIDYVEHMVAELPLPLMLYNIPALTKTAFEIDTLRKLAGLEKIVGVKDSSEDLIYYRELLGLHGERPDWVFFMGPEVNLVESVRIGGNGGVNGGANVFPRLFVRAYEAARDGDEAEAAALQAKIELFQGIYEVGKYASRHIKATKSALSILGVCDDFMAEPFHRFREPERKRVEAVLERLGGA